MSRFDASVSLTEARTHVASNRRRAETFRVCRCVLVDGSPGVAMTGRGFVLMVGTDEAIEIADGLVDAVEAIGEQS